MTSLRYMSSIGGFIGHTSADYTDLHKEKRDELCKCFVRS